MKKRNKQFVNEKQAAEITRLALPTLRNWRHLNAGPAYYKIGRAVRYSLDEILEWMERHRVETERD